MQEPKKNIEGVLNNLHWLGQASFLISTQEGVNIYIDPYRINPVSPKADLILVTHAHFDHCSLKDIAGLSKADTIIVCPPSARQKFPADTRIIKAGEKINIKGIDIEAVRSYNKDKPFHPESADNVGFIINISGVRVFHAGDTDLVPELKQVKADIAMLPVGGTYTMDPKEAAEAASYINPQVAIPMHYGQGLGSPMHGEEFRRLSKIKVMVFEPLKK